MSQVYEAELNIPEVETDRENLLQQLHVVRAQAEPVATALAFGLALPPTEIHPLSSVLFGTGTCNSGIRPAALATSSGAPCYRAR
jgi:hypothetical protein